MSGYGSYSWTCGQCGETGSHRKNEGEKMTLGQIKTGDFIEVKKKSGRDFIARVVFVGDRELEFRPIDQSITYRTATSREVVGHWRASTATRRAKGLAA